MADKTPKKNRHSESDIKSSLTDSRICSATSLTRVVNFSAEGHPAYDNLTVRPVRTAIAVHDKEMSRGPSGFLLYRLLQNWSTHVTEHPCVISSRICSCATATRLANGNSRWSISPLPCNSSRCSLVNVVMTPVLGTVSATFIGFASTSMQRKSWNAAGTKRSNHCLDPGLG